MAKLGFCIPCGEDRKDVDATLVIDGEPMCNAHAAMAQKGPVELCNRGCGKPTHRGLCVGQRVATKPAFAEIQSPVPVLPVAPLRLPAAEIEIVDFAAVPNNSTSQHRAFGRIGRLWTAFTKLPPGKAMKIACRDRKHVGSTARAMQERATKAGVSIGERRVNVDCFLWKEEE